MLYWEYVHIGLINYINTDLYDQQFFFSWRMSWTLPVWLACIRMNIQRLIFIFCHQPKLVKNECFLINFCVVSFLQRDQNPFSGEGRWDGTLFWVCGNSLLKQTSKINSFIDEKRVVCRMFRLALVALVWFLDSLEKKKKCCVTRQKFISAMTD